MKHIIISCLILVSSAVFLSAQSEGEKLFRLNKPEAAIPVLEKEIAQPDSSTLLYNYLGICYYQTQKYEHALAVFEKALSLPDADKFTLNLNAGNTAFAMQNYAKALEYFTSAVSADPENSTPVLNKANTLLKMKRWGDAKVSYEKFVEMKPDDAQSPKIIALIDLLSAQIEKDRLAKEALAAQTEQLDQNVAGLALASRTAPESELVNENLAVSPLQRPEAEYIESDITPKTPAEVESERVAGRLAAQKAAQIQSEKLTPDEVPSPAKKTAPAPAPVIASTASVVPEQVESAQLSADRNKIMQGIDAPSKEDTSVSPMLLSNADLDTIQQADVINCTLKAITEDFSPDNDGVDDSADFVLSYNNAIQDPEQWEFSIADEGGEILKIFRGRGAVPEKIVWNGLDENGAECVYSAARYVASLYIVPASSDARRAGVKTVSDTKEFRSGILLKQTGEAEWKIIVMSFRFDADKETFNDLNAQQKDELEHTLQAIVRQLKKHSDCSISVDGYANNITGSEKENKEELVPLSAKRAKVIMEELIKRGIDRKTITYAGMGGSNAIASRTDKKNWWKNRRVEFTIRKKNLSAN